MGGTSSWTEIFGFGTTLSFKWKSGLLCSRLERIVFAFSYRIVKMGPKCGTEKSLYTA